MSQFDCSQVVSIVSFGELNNKGFNLKTQALNYHFSVKSLIFFSLWWLSNMVVLGGSAAYARVRQLEMAARSSRDSSSLPVQKDVKNTKS